MPHYVYVLRSEKTGRYYVGSSGDPWQRLGEHNAGFALNEAELVHH